LQRTRHEDYIKGRIRIQGFTLIELSIVLVIIGLIVGGVLVGRDLISAAQVRAQVTQIEKYNAAVNTFRGKFNAIPGDMRPELAAQFGFIQGSGCNGGFGSRDGNGLIDGPNSTYNLDQGSGETGLFWQDISSPAAGNLIDGQFPNGNVTALDCIHFIYLPATGISNYLPVAKMGDANFVYVYEVSGYNWFGILGITGMPAAVMTGNTNIKVSQAAAIDKKIDDGLPTSGNVQATYINQYISLALSPNWPFPTFFTCFDTTTNTYSITFNNGNGGNCALSFKMQ
jgi:prepilin-type N-terminal cleavage/methylation domain-containing protein